MRNVTLLLILSAVLLSSQFVSAQTNRITYNNQQLFLSGSNLAWASFANDVGTGNPDTNRFADVMLQMHDHGGNVMRWWLHTNGTVSPEFDGSNYVIGPGTNTISDIKKVLDIAWRREISVDLCLWSFDMQKSSGPGALDAATLNRNWLLLTDTNYTRAYINNCLIPMVDSLKGHPAILAWEIFNEPEGMSNEFGWSTTNHVAMSSIQRFVNLCAAAIHRTDTTAKVTNGAWSFYALCDGPSLPKTAASLQKLSAAEINQITNFINKKYRLSESPDQIMADLQKMTAANQKNYYSDSNLIYSGGDPDGKLDFYSVHYYSGINPSSPTALSPFHHPASYWNLNKPIVVAEFAMESGQGNPPSIPKASLYDTLYQLGYAGALGWSWTDIAISNPTSMLAGMQSMWDLHQTDVDILGIAGAYPIVTITSPLNNAKITDTAAITITANASDSDGHVDSVSFYIGDTVRIGVVVDTPYTFIWQNVTSGTYTLSAVATDNNGNRRISNRVLISVGKPSMIRYEAETTRYQGPNVTIGNDATASGGRYINMASQDSTARIYWYITNVASAGNYQIAFGYKLNYASPKSQFIQVNGAPFDTLAFTGASTSTWYETSMNVDLVHGMNTIMMQAYWGWMYIDYIAVPREVVTSVNAPSIVPVSFSLEQNYPNPFNPVTTIRYSIERPEHVKLIIYDILGRQISTLVNEVQDAGLHNVQFNANALPSGVYFYRVTAGSSIQTKRMILIK